MVCNMFQLLGHKAEMIHARCKPEEREEILRKFKNKEINLLISVDIISEGFDVPSCEVVILLRPTKSLSLYLQQVGRALRVMDGKSHAIVLDHAGNVFKHGFPTEEREWELTDTKVKAAQKKHNLRQCKTCYAVFSTFVERCPECGEKHSPEPKKMQMVAGELVPIEEVALKKKQAQRELAGPKTLDDWIRLAKVRGYKIGWAYHRYNARKRRQ